MVAQQGKTLIPIYYNYTRAGFDPDKDMLQAYVGDWIGQGPPKWLVNEGGGLYTDWNLRTSLDRLYAAGWQVFRSGAHANAAVTGNYAGIRAAHFASGATLPTIDRAQVEAEKARIYAPLLKKNGLGWKDLNSGVARINQDYCTADKDPEVIKIGLSCCLQTTVHLFLKIVGRGSLSSLKALRRKSNQFLVLGWDYGAHAPFCAGREERSVFTKVMRLAQLF